MATLGTLALAFDSGCGLHTGRQQITKGDIQKADGRRQ